MPNNSILGVFAKSPIKPLEKHIRIVNKCARQLHPFFDAVKAKDWDRAAKMRKEISQLEKDADALKRQLRLELPGGLFMPVDRADLLELLTQQDRIANKAKDISGRVIGRELSIPADLENDFFKYLARCLDAIDMAADAINELDDLLETGFRGREVDLVEKMIHKLDEIEDDTDSMQIGLRTGLLAIEKDLNPVDVMFLYQIIEWVGDLADLAERVGARLEILLAKN
ncbi:TIGR00153 family protein [Thalassotalea euphylliae]|uniref:TIGR00153 family protein n=1 Tax=Thalassotalea euphylliae TaxID=1655234 RepID=A0A3E0U547_9GAMM|nr:TIGR00153 family protein [Thalassotalea euphylliae]REL32121.1 TIGR00153 family protein [Thalassotalea euphylliae]REL36397.1 TIGR00153 family protein [Thalassotalea euphylliae]